MTPRFARRTTRVAIPSAGWSQDMERLIVTLGSSGTTATPRVPISAPRSVNAPPTTSPPIVRSTDTTRLAASPNPSAVEVGRPVQGELHAHLSLNGVLSSPLQWLRAREPGWTSEPRAAPTPAARLQAPHAVSGAEEATKFMDIVASPR